MTDIDICTVIDLSSLYPEWMQTSVTRSLLAHSKEHYRDFMLIPQEGRVAPPWFLLFMWMELFFHVPISFWSIPALLNGELSLFWLSFALQLLDSPPPFSELVSSMGLVTVWWLV